MTEPRDDFSLLELLYPNELDKNKPRRITKIVDKRGNNEKEVEIEDKRLVGSSSKIGEQSLIALLGGIIH
jgi:hypothetical protein